MSLKSAIYLGAAIFVLTVLVRLPAAVLTLLLPAAIHCQAPSGTLWQGSCGELRSGAVEISDVRWTLHPLALLRARVAVEVQSDDARASGRAHLTLRSNGDFDIQSLNATLPMQGGLSLMPAGWSGTVEVVIQQASVQGGHLTALQGAATVRQLHSDHPPSDLGSFELDFPTTSDTDARAAAPGGVAPSAAAPMVGTLRDFDGPLSLQSQVHLSPTGAYEIAGTAAARNSSNADLQQMLQLLGPADAQGRHAFSLAGTL
jgi:hypothetical protein